MLFLRDGALNNIYTFKFGCIFTQVLLENTTAVVRIKIIER